MSGPAGCLELLHKGTCVYNNNIIIIKGNTKFGEILCTAAVYY